MSYDLVWTTRALRRLDEIGAYIAAENPEAAQKVVGRIATAVQRLSEYPNSGRPGRLHNTRELVLADIPYVVPYRVIRGRVQIITVMHASQRWPLRR
jgi:addiction module RelE/StbE family toxin